MPTITIEGQQVPVSENFFSLTPEQQDATVDEIAREMGIAGQPQPQAQPQPAPQQPDMSTGEDMLRGGATGLRQGIEGLGGMFGDAAKMQGDIAGWVAGKFGASPETQETVSGVGRRLNPFGFAPSTQEIQSVTTPVIGENYQPQTTAGEYARTVGQFAPGAVAGPGGIARKTAMTVIPAVASETAGQMTKGTEAEPYARAVTALAGGVAAAGRNPSTVKNAAKNAPTREAVKQTTDNLYQAMRDSGIRYDADEYARTVTRIATDLHKKGLREPVAKQAHEIVATLAKDMGKSPDFDDINGWISSIKGKARDLRKQGDEQEALAVDIIADHLDDFESSAVMVSDKNLPREQFDRMRKGARALALRNIKERSLQEIMDKADTYAAGQEAGVRNGINNLLRSKKGMQLFRGEERKALLEVAQGRKPLLTLSRFGFDLSNLGGRSTFIPTIGALGAGAVASPAVGAGLAIAGTAAKAASPALTNRAMDTARAAIRSGKLNTKPAMDAAKAQRMQAFVRTLLAAKSGENSAIANTPVR